MFACICLAAFLIAAGLNLAASLKENRKLFAATKPTLLLLLCLYCLFHGGSAPDFLLIGALFCCFLGDVLLMIKGNGWFFAGGISFLVGHVLLILVFARDVDFSRLPLGFLIPAALVYIGAAAFVIYRSWAKTPGLLRAPMILYLFCNASMNLFAFSRLFGRLGIWTAVSCGGAVLFFVSDCILLLLRFGGWRAKYFKTDFAVMLTYLSGVLLITLGLIPPAV